MKEPLTSKNCLATPSLFIQDKSVIKTFGHPGDLTGQLAGLEGKIERQPLILWITRYHCVTYGCETDSSFTPPPFLPLPHFGLDARSGPQTNKIRPNILTKGQQRSWRASEEDVGAHHPTPRKSQNCILNSRQEKRPMYISPYFCSLLILYFVFFSWEEIPFSRTDDGPQSREAW